MRLSILHKSSNSLQPQTPECILNLKLLSNLHNWQSYFNNSLNISIITYQSRVQIILRENDLKHSENREILGDHQFLFIQQCFLPLYRGFIFRNLGKSTSFLYSLINVYDLTHSHMMKFWTRQSGGFAFTKNGHMSVPMQKNAYKNWRLNGQWLWLTNKNMKFHEIMSISRKYIDTKKKNWIWHEDSLFHDTGISFKTLTICARSHEKHYPNLSRNVGVAFTRQTDGQRRWRLWWHVKMKMEQCVLWRTAQKLNP